MKKEGTYNNCFITVTDYDGYISKPLIIPSFTVKFTRPKINIKEKYFLKNNVLKLIVHSSVDGYLNLTGNCKTKAKKIFKGDRSIKIYFLGNGLFTDCEINLIDEFSNSSKILNLGHLEIDTKKPLLKEIKSIPKFSIKNRLSYSLYSSENGFLKVYGDCKTNINKINRGINHISLFTNKSLFLNNCYIKVVDKKKNVSLPLKISTFILIK